MTVIYVGNFHKVSDIIRKYFSVDFRLTLRSAYFNHMIVPLIKKQHPIQHSPHPSSRRRPLDSREAASDCWSNARDLQK